MLNTIQLVDTLEAQTQTWSFSELLIDSLKLTEKQGIPLCCVLPRLSNELVFQKGLGRCVHIKTPTSTKMETQTN